MLGRFIEDAYVLGRFAYFYAKAPEHMGQHRLGFAPVGEIKKRDRLKWAWSMTLGGGRQQ